MITLGMTGTKWDIFTASVELFSKNGYGNVSIRNIGDAVGIKSAALYYHFKNKDEILALMYQFYLENYVILLPDVDELVGLIGKVSQDEIFRKINVLYEEVDEKLMTKIMQIATKERDRDKRAESLLGKIFVETPKKYFGMLLPKMIEQNVIEPLDTEAWSTVITHYVYAGIARAYSIHAMKKEEYDKGIDFLFGLIHSK